jgi:hypothetical protein
MPMWLRRWEFGHRKGAVAQCRESLALRQGKTPLTVKLKLWLSFSGFPTKESHMAYVYTAVRKLENQPKVDDFECVSLIRRFAKTPATFLWREGSSVMGDRTLAHGTAIAIFVKGKWPAKPHGNHAALYLGQVSDGMYIMDQWNRSDKEVISSRFIYRLGKKKDGTFKRPSDNADAFSVIE